VGCRILREYIGSGAGGEVGDADVWMCRLNGKYEVQGAEEPQAFLQVFGEIKADAGAGGVSGGENVC